jgi:hypothetical protein
MKLGRRGQTLPGVWIVIIIGMFVVTTVYIMFHQIVTHHFYDLALQMGVDTDTLGILMTGWNTWPVLFFIALFLWGLANSGKDTTYQRRG